MHCNHKLIYKSLPEKNSSYGLDNICILEQDFLRGDSAIEEERYGFFLGDYDNVVCDSQRIYIGSKVEKWHFIGFSYWGNVKEIIKVIFEDNSEDWFEIAFVDWVGVFNRKLWNLNFLSERSKVVIFNINDFKFL